jgi:uncharacterized membrane protein YgcG
MSTTEPKKTKKIEGRYDKHGSGLKNFQAVPEAFLQTLQHSQTKYIGDTVFKITSYLQDLGIAEFVNTKVSRVSLDSTELEVLARQIRSIVKSSVPLTGKQHELVSPPSTHVPSQEDIYSVVLDQLVAAGSTSVDALKTLRNHPGAPKPQVEATPSVVPSTSLGRPTPLIVGLDEDAQVSSRTRARAAQESPSGSEASENFAIDQDVQNIRVAPEAIALDERAAKALISDARAKREARLLQAKTPSPDTKRLLHFRQDGIKSSVEPAWVTLNLKDKTTDGSSRAMDFLTKTPWKKKAVPGTVAPTLPELTEHERRIQTAMTRIDSKVAEQTNTWFEHYDVDDPMACIPECTSDVEKRIFVWFILKRVFKSNAANFTTVVKYDVRRFVLTAWQTLYQTAITSDDDPFITYRNLQIYSHERFSDFISRAQEMVKDINDTGLHNILQRAFHVHIYKVLSSSSLYWKELVKTAEVHEWTLEEAIKKFTTQSAKTPLSEQTGATPPATTALLARIALLEGERAQSATYTSGTNGNSFGSHARNKGRAPPGACFQFFKFAACPSGATCPYKHDPAIGPVGNTTLPDWYTCHWCKLSNAHWGRVCPHPDAVESRAKRAAEQVASEAAKTQRTVDGNTARGGGQGRGKGGSKGGGRRGKGGASGGKGSSGAGC